MYSDGSPGIPITSPEPNGGPMTLLVESKDKVTLTFVEGNEVDSFYMKHTDLLDLLKAAAKHGLHGTVKEQPTIEELL